MGGGMVIPRYIGAALVLVMLRPPADSASERPPARALRAVASVSGTVFDSVAGHPLEGALVQLVSADHRSRTRSTTSAADGTFRFDSVSSGLWVAGFYHRVLDEYGVQVPLTRLRVIGSAQLRTTLAVPSARAIIGGACGALDGPDQGVYIGYVRTARGTTPARDAGVEVKWNAFSLEGRGITRSTPTLEVETSAEGGFSVCGVPAGGVVVARAWAGRDSSGFVELEVPKSGFLRRDLLIATNPSLDEDALPATGSDTSIRATTRVTHGDGRLRGRVTRSTGAPVRNARVLLWGSGVEVSTDADGAYVMTGLPLGTWTLEGRALGFVRARQPVDIIADGSAVANVKLDAVTAVLDTVRVMGQRIAPSPDMRDFERRRKSGFGTFLDETDIERRHPIFAADLFRMVPGVSVVPTGMFSHAILMRARSLGVSSDSLSRGGDFCVPAFYIDGVRVYSGDGDVEMFVSPPEIRAIEIFTGATNVPAEFNSTKGCGSVLIHTGARNAFRVQH